MSCTFHPPFHFSWDAFIEQVLKEDTNDKNDLTSQILIPSSLKGKMNILVKEKGIIAGVEAAEIIFKKRLGRKVKIQLYLQDGQKVKPGDVAFEIFGPLKELLLLERPVLNIMQRMSGIATYTHKLQHKCRGTHARVTDTRKTTPLFRYFEKWAVCIGGGTNHRFGLYDAILIKDNHIDAAGGIKNALIKVSEYLKKNPTIYSIVEARTLNDVKIILEFPEIRRILLDNFSVKETRKAVLLCAGKKQLESSGGITEKNIRSYALTGVDFISIGALTHSYQSLDLSMKIEQ